VTRRALLTGVVVMVAAGASPRRAHAIPAFARIYRVPCSTCHTVVTRRSEFGDVFRKAGYHWPGADDGALAPPPIEMKGAALQPGLFPIGVPLAVLATMSAAYTNDPNAETKLVLGKPALRLLLGGNFGRHVAFFGTWSGQGPPGELYLHVARPIKCRPELNVRVGLLDPTTTLFKANDAIVAPYILSSDGLNGHTISQGRTGGELNGALFHRLFWAAGAVQNGGIGSNIDTYYHASYKLGGMNYEGELPDSELEGDSPWSDLVITAGHWGYWGRVANLAGDDIYRIRRFGLDLKISFRDLAVWGGVMYGLDRDRSTYVDNRSLTWFAEASYAIRSWLVPMYMYQYQDAASFMRERQTHDLGVAMLALENVRILAKLGYSPDGVENESAELKVLVAF
jgi:hypothetical protein